MLEMKPLLQFADTKAQLDSFTFALTFSSFLEGSFVSCSRHILMNDYLQRGKGFCLLLNGKPVNWRSIYRIERFGEHFIDVCEDLQDGIILGKYCYKLIAETDCEHHLAVKWYSDSIDTSRPFIDILQENTQKLEFHSLCKFTDICDF